MSYNQNIDRMFIEYKVYRKMSDLKPFISRDELPSCHLVAGMDLFDVIEKCGVSWDAAVYQMRHIS